MAVIYIHLLGNYIAVSINSNKREIGILRALGAKKSDIFAIYINECIIITIIVIVLTLLSLMFACIKYNADVTAYGIEIQVVRMTVRQFALIFSLGIGTTALSSAIPLYMLSRKKPIDCISDR